MRISPGSLRGFGDPLGDLDIPYIKVRFSAQFKLDGAQAIVIVPYSVWKTYVKFWKQIISFVINFINLHVKEEQSVSQMQFVVGGVSC